jgi:transposase
MALRLRPMTADEVDMSPRRAHSRTEPARLVERARIIWLAHQGQPVPAIARELRLCHATVRSWLTRCNCQGLAGFQEAPRPGRPATYTAEQVREVIATSLTKPQELSLPFARWPRDRRATYLQEVKGLPLKRSRLDELLRRDGLRWGPQETWFGERVAPAFAEKRGSSRRSIPRRRRAGSSWAWMRGGPKARRACQGASWWWSTSTPPPRRGRPRPPRPPLARPPDP